MRRSSGSTSAGRKASFCRRPSATLRPATGRRSTRHFRRTAIRASAATPTLSSVASSRESSTWRQPDARPGATTSKPLLDELEGMLRLSVAPRLLPLRELDLFAWRALVGNLVEQVRDEVEARAPLVVRPHDIPRGEVGVGRLEHLVARPRVVVPAAVRLEIHRRELPDLARVVDARFEPARLLVLAHFEPIFDEDDT